jgi:hypothetical protein
MDTASNQFRAITQDRLLLSTVNFAIRKASEAYDAMPAMAFSMQSL